MISNRQIARARKPAAPKAPGESRPIQLLRRAYYYGREKALQNLSGMGVTERQAAALRAIARHGAMTQSALGVVIGMQPANVHGLINRLQEKQLVSAERDPSSSKRKRINLTRKGRLLVSRLLHAVERAELETLERLTPEEQGLFLELLNKIVG